MTSLRLTSVFVLLACLTLTGCKKEDYSDTYAFKNHNHEVTQTNVYYLNVTYTGIGQQLAESGCIESLWNKCTREDAVLVYSKEGQNTSGSTIYWQLNPFIASDGRTNYYYHQGDGGLFYFFADAGEGYHWTSNPTKYFKIVVIPHSVYTAKSAEGVDHSNYDEVVKAYNINEAEAIRLN